MLSYQAAFYLHSGNVPGRQGREHDSIATYGTFTAGDGVEFVLAALSDRMWERICHVIGSDDLAKDSRFLTAGDRTRRRAILIPLLEQKFATRGADEWMSIFDREGVPVGVVNTVDRVVVDPQIVHRGMITELTSDDGRKVSVVGDPMKFSESRRNEATYPPAVGEHTSEVLKSVLKMTDAEIAALASAGVVGLRKAALKRDRVA